MAIVFNFTPINEDKNTFNIFSAAASYEIGEKFRSNFAAEITRIEDNENLLRSLGVAQLSDLAFSKLVLHLITHKNSGFREENERRIIYAPTFFGDSPIITQDVEIVGGAPQLVKKLPLELNDKPDFPWWNLNTLVDHVVIGPMSEQEVVAEAFVALLDKAGFENAHGRVRRSSISLR